jgi:hypothetical protein
MKTKRAILPLLAVGALVFAGCETSTTIRPVGDNRYWVCDDDPNGEEFTCGANPEKGLRDTCFKDGRTIADIRRLPDKAIIVTCGGKR